MCERASSTWSRRCHPCNAGVPRLRWHLRPRGPDRDLVFAGLKSKGYCQDLRLLAGLARNRRRTKEVLPRRRPVSLLTYVPSTLPAWAHAASSCWPMLPCQSHAAVFWCTGVWMVVKCVTLVRTFNCWRRWCDASILHVKRPLKRLCWYWCLLLCRGCWCCPYTTVVCCDAWWRGTPSSRCVLLCSSCGGVRIGEPNPPQVALCWLVAVCVLRRHLD